MAHEVLRAWQQLTPADRELIATSARKHLNSLFSTYTSVEAEMLKNIEGTKKIKVVKAGPEFFGDVPQKWEEIWLKRAPVLADLRKEVAAIK